jgi:hypothetical protein
VFCVGELRQALAKLVELCFQSSDVVFHGSILPSLSMVTSMSSWEAMFSLIMSTNIRGIPANRTRIGLNRRVLSTPLLLGGSAAAALPTAGALVATSVAAPQSKANGSIRARMVLTTAPDSGRPKDTDQKSLLAVKLNRPLLLQRVNSKHFPDESWSKD